MRVRILLTRLSSLGDVVHTWPLVEALARVEPRPHLTWVVEEQYLPLVAPHPAVDRALPVATRRWRRRPGVRTWREIRSVVTVLREAPPEVALDPQGLVKSAVWAYLARARRRVGLAPEVRRERAAGLFYSDTSPSPRPHRHAVDVALSLLPALGIEPRWGAWPDGRFLLSGTAPVGPDAAGQGPVMLLPGTGRASKSWGTGSLIELARRLADAGLEVEVLWGPAEHDLAQAIAREARVPLAPPTPLPALPTHLARARGVVGGDTGPAHLAAALGVPTVMFHLDTDPQRSGVRGHRVTLLDGRPGTAPALTPAAVAAAAMATFASSRS
ncbi:MAG: lipopolysaccharide heptosyltransferase I [Acidobacteriota bacterium]|jgi:heptosyltransferase-1